MRIALLLALLCLLPAILHAADSDQDAAQPYEEIRYPTFKDGRLQSQLVAKQAEAYDITEGTPRINLTDVVITIYDMSEEALAATPDDAPLPVRMTVTSDRGYFTRRPPEPGAPLEDIANLEGNVVLRQMRAGAVQTTRPTTRPARLAPGVETEIRCEHAQWNNNLRKLNSDGEVELLQEDSRITGTGFLYLADDDSFREDGGADPNIKDWGGIVFIEHNARMEIDRDSGLAADPVSTAADPASGATGRTTITCLDTASYKLREREIQFEREVKISREGLVIESDILKVFLRREDEMAEGGQNADAAPGQVKNIVATIGKRPGSVLITGYNRDAATGDEIVQYTARGGRADFDYDNNRITLTDTREQRWPEVELGIDRDRITDGTLIFVFTQVSASPDSPLRPSGEQAAETVLDSLTTYGGRGEVVLRSRRPEDTGPTIPTIVNYRGDMNYNRVDGRIRFQEAVSLRRGDLAIRSELLDIRLSSDGTSVEPNQVNRIFAETEVIIRTGEYDASAHRAEYEVYHGVINTAGASVDILRLFSPGGTSPANPRVRDQRGNQISAPEIHMQRLYTEAGQRDQHLLVARGVSACDFATGTTLVNGAPTPRIVSIHCERGMEYNQANKRARFEGSVNATSDIPEDSYVLTSDRLVVDFEEAPASDDTNDYDTWFRRITAEGNARLVQDNRVCEATNIIRDFPTSDPRSGDIYLQGSAGQDGLPPQMAILREEDGNQNIGAMFVAPLIKSSSMGELVQANGPGQLSMPDTPPEGAAVREYRSEIHFAGAASYESLQGGAVSDARFWGGVVLRQPSRNVNVTADEMDARFIRETGDNDFGGQRIDVELERVGRLRRIEARFNVRLEHALPREGRRVAVGDVGVVEFTTSGNIIRLSADRSVDNRRFVTARDHDGLTLRSPEIEIREAQGITRAAGPGDLQIPADAAGEGMSGAPTRILYGENGSMVYNELALNIRVDNNVRVVQPGAGGNWSFPSLDGICDRMDISLLEPPVVGGSGEDILSRIRQMDAVGHVLLRVYAESTADNPNQDWLNRPGTTFFTRGDQAQYDVRQGQVSIFCNDNRQPQLLLNMVEPGSAPRRQRLKADRFVLQTNSSPRRWNFEGELDSDTIGEGEPFDFAD